MTDELGCQKGNLEDSQQQEDTHTPGMEGLGGEKQKQWTWPLHYLRCWRRKREGEIPCCFFPPSSSLSSEPPAQPVGSQLTGVGWGDTRNISLREHMPPDPHPPSPPPPRSDTQKSGRMVRRGSEERRPRPHSKSHPFLYSLLWLLLLLNI